MKNIKQRVREDEKSSFVVGSAVGKSVGLGGVEGAPIAIDWQIVVAARVDGRLADEIYRVLNVNDTEFGDVIAKGVAAHVALDVAPGAVGAVVGHAALVLAELAIGLASSEVTVRVVVTETRISNDTAFIQRVGHPLAQTFLASAHSSLP